MKNHKYNSGENNYNYNSVRAIATWSNGDVEEDLTPYDFTIVEKIIENQKGNKTFKISYEGREATSENVNVFTVLTGIEFVSGCEVEDFVEYNATGKYFDNVKLNAIYNDGTKEEVSVNNYDVSFINDIGENVTVTFTYENVSPEGLATKSVTDTFAIREYYKSLVVVAKDVNTSNYFLTGSNFVKENFRYYPQFTKNRGNEITDLTKIAVSEVKKDVSQDYVELTYTEYNNVDATRVNIYFVDSWDQVPTVEIEGVELVGLYETRVAHNSTYDYSGVSIVVTYSNTMTKTINYSDFASNNVVVDATVDTTTVGNKTFTFTYTAEGVDYTLTSNTVEVVKTLNSVTVTGAVAQVLYGEDSAFNNVKLTLHYSTGDVVVNAKDYGNYTWPTKENLASNNHNAVMTVTYAFTPDDCFDNTTKTATMTVNVNETITRMIQKGITQKSVTVNTAPIDLTVLENNVYFVYTSGNEELVPVKGETTSGYTVLETIDTSVVGKQRIMIVYQTYNGETFDNTYYLYVLINVEDVILGYNAMVGDKIVYHYNDSNIPTLDVNKVTVEQNATFEGSSIVLVPQYASGATVLRSEYVLKGQNGFIVTSPLDTSVLGEKTMTISYQGNSYVITINIVGQNEDYTILNVTLPNSIQNFNNVEKNEYVSSSSTGVKGFENIEQTYVVGSNNAFKFEPIVLVQYTNGLVGSVTNYTYNAEIELKTGNSWTTEGVDGKVTYNGSTHTFAFTSGAEGNTFRITVTPNGIFVNGEEKSAILEFKVIDAYNIYTADELSIVDNKNHIVEGTTEGKWTEFKANYLAQTGIDLNQTICGVVLHNDITITRDNIPAIHFYTEDELNTTDPDYELTLGSLKDSLDDPLEFLYYREIQHGQTFTIEGNYFQVDLSKMPLMVRANGRVNTTNSAITTHTTVFGIRGNIDVDVPSAEQMPEMNINNLALLGNAKKSENTSLSGGIIGIKAGALDLNVYNNLVQKFYIAYMVEGVFGENYHNFNSNNIVKTNIFDSYNTMLYIWGVKEFNIDSCHMIGAGGPVMICDHVGNEETTGEGGYTSNVYVDNHLEDYGYTTTETSVLESWVAGTEGWFETYTGSGALAQQIKSYSKLYEEKGKTLLNGAKINLIAVYKSGSVEGLSTSMIRGQFNDSSVEYKFNIHNVDNYVYMAKQIGLYDIVKDGVIQQQILPQVGNDWAVAEDYFAANVENTDAFKQEVCNQIRNYSSQGVFLVTDSGSVAFPGTEGWYKDDYINGEPNDALVSATQKLMYVYLFNGMGATIGVSDYTAE